MIIPDKNQLDIPDVVETPDYERQLEKFKQAVVNYIRVSDTELAKQVEQTLSNEAEILTKMVEACTVILQTRIRELNEDALQMFALWAQGKNLDAVVSNLGIERQVIEEAKPDSFPPEPGKMESDESLRLRYFLAPFSFSNAGPALAYKYHVLTLGERPNIRVETPEVGKVVITHQINQASAASLIKDVQVQQTAPGKVKISLLSREANGHASDGLIKQVENYLKQSEVCPLTDLVEVVSAKIIPYKIEAKIAVSRSPDAELIRQRALRKLTEYVEKAHRIHEQVEFSMLYHVLHEAGATKIDLITPSKSIFVGVHEAAYCSPTDINVSIL